MTTNLVMYFGPYNIYKTTFTISDYPYLLNELSISLATYLMRLVHH